MRAKIAYITGILMCGTLVFSLFLAIANYSSAQESLPEPVEFARKAIIANQEYITANRPIVEEFERRKENNAVQTGILKAYGYSFDWSMNQIVKEEGLQ